VSETISLKALRGLVDEWLGAGKAAFGPRLVKEDLVQYAPLGAGDELLVAGFVHPANSIKEFFFPRHEKLYGYARRGKEIELVDAPGEVPETLVIGARPCDAAMLPILDHIFNWDFVDGFYNRRRDAATVVTLACAGHDDACFCTSVGLSPDSTKGADAMLVDLGEDGFEVRALTDKGRRLFSGKTTQDNRTAAKAKGPAPKFDPAKVREFLEGNFESPFWAEQTLRCAGCGACAYTCPTCHCFDIVDEGNTAGGVRARNWDSCQFGLFTLHASGHNPRTAQPQRQRQRVLHKFSIYPRKFGEVLCTGCGNCLRNCPVGLGVPGVLMAMEDVSGGANV
jgi:ferredoxin